MKAIASKDHNVREAACRAAGQVDTSISTDKIKIGDALAAAVMNEPAKAEDKSTADWANDESVRQACAEALEQIALVRTLPALIKALDDNDSRVRGAAFRALKEITRRDFEYEKDEQGPGQDVRGRQAPRRPQEGAGEVGSLVEGDAGRRRPRGALLGLPVPVVPGQRVDPQRPPC